MQLCLAARSRLHLKSVAFVGNTVSRRDPSRTSGLQNRFMRDMNKRWDALKVDLRASIVDNDCFGIQPRQVLGLGATESRQFAFVTTDQKLAAFTAWLEEQERLGILELERRPGPTGTNNQPWTDVYVDAAYRQGVARGNVELRKAGYPVPEIDKVLGGMQAVLSEPIHADRIAVLYGRTFEDLKSVTQFTNGQIRRQIADGLTSGLARGLAEGKNPKIIARELYKDIANRVDSIGKVRCRMIARTEIMRAHHIASIQEYRRAEVEGVEIEAELLTADDPCPECSALADAGPYSIDEVEGMIPVHPQCRCVTIPVPRGGGEW